MHSTLARIPLRDRDQKLRVQTIHRMKGETKGRGASSAKCRSSPTAYRRMFNYGFSAKGSHLKNHISINVFGYNVSVKLHAAEVIFLRFSPISLPFNSFPYLELYPDRGIIIDDARSCAAAGPFAWSLVFLLARLHACMLRGSCYSPLESQHPTMTSSA